MGFFGNLFRGIKNGVGNIVRVLPQVIGGARTASNLIGRGLQIGSQIGPIRNFVEKHGLEGINSSIGRGLESLDQGVANKDIGSIYNTIQDGVDTAVPIARRYYQR